MKVDGPNKRALRSVLAQLRHMYMLMKTGQVLNEMAVVSIADRILHRQIKRLEDLDRSLFEDA